MKITLVGAGRWATLISEKYRKRGFELKGVISPEAPTRQPLANLPWSPTPSEWIDTHGSPGNEVYDLAVHPEHVLSLVQELVNAGATSFILPKMFVQDNEELDELTALVEDYELNVFVASQWKYSHIVQTLAEVLKENGEIRLVEITFCQRIEEARRAHYTVINALLPHMFQILFSCGACTDNTAFSVEDYHNTSIRLQSTGPPEVLATTSIDQEDFVREAKFFLNEEETASIIADFSDRGSKTPTIRVDGQKMEFPGDILEQMIDAMETELRRKDTNYREQLPLMKKLLEIQKDVKRCA